MREVPAGSLVFFHSFGRGGEFTVPSLLGPPLASHPVLARRGIPARSESADIIVENCTIGSTASCFMVMRPGPGLCVVTLAMGASAPPAGGGHRWGRGIHRSGLCPGGILQDTPARGEATVSLPTERLRVHSDTILVNTFFFFLRALPWQSEKEGPHRWQTRSQNNRRAAKPPKKARPNP